MRKYIKTDLCNIIEQLANVNETLINKGKGVSQEQVQGILTDCQQGAVDVGSKIEEVEGEGTEAVRLLEEYCEKVYLLCINWNDVKLRDKELKNVRVLLNKVKNSILYDIKDSKKEVVFLPYKASMWDSLESVWKAADEDPECDAYVIPIPYYDKNPDGSFKEVHYEGDLYPKYVPITDWQEYDLEKRHPDVIFIHNPYDAFNFVTSVHPAFYSYELKKDTDCLVYVPYYTTTGSMNKSRGECSAYHFVDYIIIQAEGFRRFFSKDIPNEKFLALGSPKFDRVIKMSSENQKIPEEWEKKIAGRKVYFYNTSINGMLADTPAFLRKMKYVFECFEGRTDACLLWRPHPLLESTFLSMRKELAPIYTKLKEYFMISGLGIYDDTPDVEMSIALSDAYIGDSKSSVVSLFGVSGKPIFILNNNIDRRPSEKEFLGSIWNVPYANGTSSWLITQCNQIYYAPEGNYCYKYFGALSNDIAGSYSHCLTIGNKTYICPTHAQDVPVIESDTIRKIVLKQTADTNYSFSKMVSDGKYLFLIPCRYHSIVRIHLESEKVDYFDIKSQLFTEENLGNACIHKGQLYITSLNGPSVLVMDVETGRQTVEAVGSDGAGGANAIISNGDELWLLPCLDRTVRRWNTKSGEVTEYNCYPEKFSCYNPFSNKYPGERPFNNVVFVGEYAYFTAHLANMCICLNVKTGLMEEWKTPFEMPKEPISGYYKNALRCAFVQQISETVWLFFSYYDASLYEIDMATGVYRQIMPEFDMKEVMKHEIGFGTQSIFAPYACKENVFNTLECFLSNEIAGNAYSREKQLEQYSKISANTNGTSGEMIYKTILDFQKK